MNVAVIVLDTLRKDKISVYNDDVDFTNNIQEFSKNSTVYTEAVSQGPWTLPSISSILTGEYPWKHGANQETLYLENNFKQLPEIFSEKGYKTGAYSQNPWISKSSGLNRGFEQLENYLPGMVKKAEESERIDLKKLMDKAGWFINFWFEHFGRGYKSIKKIQEKLFGKKEGEETRKVFDDSLKFIEESNEDFFLFMNLMTVHYPKEPPKKYREKHLNQPEKELEEELSHETENGLENVNVDRVNSAYNACTDYLDDEFGRFINKLEDQDELEDTLIVVLSDHGENLGEDQRVGHSFSVSNSLIEVPLIIKQPEQEKTTVENQVELKELYKAIPKMVEGEELELGTEYAKGGYGYPDLDLKAAENIERSRDSKMHYVKKQGKKLVKEMQRVGGEKILAENLDEEEKQELKSKLPETDDQSNTK